MAIAAAVNPAAIGMAAQTVPRAYSCRSMTGSIRSIDRSRSRSAGRSRTEWRVSGRTGCRSRWSSRACSSSWLSRHWPIAWACPVSPKAAHSSTAGDGGGVRDRDEFDLTFAVDGAVHRGADDVPPPPQGLRHSAATILQCAVVHQPLRSGAEEEDPVLPAQISLVRQRAQQVVGGGKRKSRFPCQLFGRGPVAMGAHSLQQPQRPLHRSDQRRNSGTRCRGQRSPPGMVTGGQPACGGRPHRSAAGLGSRRPDAVQTTGQGGD